MLRSFARSILRRVATQSMIRNEHFTPKPGLDLSDYLKQGNKTAVHHLLRYVWATRVLTGADSQAAVLDVACGAGYGTHMMAKEHQQLHFIGVDYDPSAIRMARQSYQMANLEYRAGDVLRWDETIGATRFATIISFDTLEHVTHREIMMENLVSHLQADGQLLLSTPCGWDENHLQPRWVHHQIEYSSASLFDFLSRYFHRVIRPDTGELPHLDVFNLLEGSGVTYLLKMNPVLCRGPVAIENPYRH
jgi:SAM-dependent methyltransferase